MSCQDFQRNCRFNIFIPITNITNYPLQTNYLVLKLKKYRSPLQSNLIAKTLGTKFGVHIAAGGKSSIGYEAETNSGDSHGRDGDKISTGKERRM